MASLHEESFAHYQVRPSVSRRGAKRDGRNDGRAFACARRVDHLTRLEFSHIRPEAPARTEAESDELAEIDGIFHRMIRGESCIR